MTREEKVNVVLAFLGPLIFDDEAGKPGEPVQITFQSARRAVMKVGDGEPQTLQFESPFLLRWALDQFVEYNADHECKDWECCVHEQCDEADFEEKNGDVVYDPELVENHIYHSIRFCEDLIDGYPKNNASI